MAILVDLSQFVIACAIEMSSGKEKIPLTVDILRHVTLNTIRSYRVKHKARFGELIICCDSHSWRYEAFPLYKAGRKVERDKNEQFIPWDIIFDGMKTIKAELEEFFPYKVVKAEGAEADDIIAVLSRDLSRAGERVLILSSDHDFIQLHAYPGVTQYSPLKKKEVRHEDPVAYRKEKIIRGDKGDGIPNIKSADDVFTVGVRQGVISAKFFAEHMEKEPEDYSPDIFRNFKRNQMLIDLIDFVPKEVDGRIGIAFENAHVADRKGLLNFFINRRMRGMLDKIQEF